MLLVVEFLGDAQAEGNSNTRLGVAQFRPSVANRNTNYRMGGLMGDIGLTRRRHAHKRCAYERKKPFHAETPVAAQATTGILPCWVRLTPGLHLPSRLVPGIRHLLEAVHLLTEVLVGQVAPMDHVGEPHQRLVVFTEV